MWCFKRYYALQCYQTNISYQLLLVSFLFSEISIVSSFSVHPTKHYLTLYNRFLLCQVSSYIQSKRITQRAGSSQTWTKILTISLLNMSWLLQCKYKLIVFHLSMCQSSGSQILGHYVHSCKVTLMSDLIEAIWILISASVFNLLQCIVFQEVSEQNLPHKYRSRKREEYFSSLLDNCRYSSLVLYQYLANGSFLKFSCNVDFETFLLSVLLKYIGLHCTLNGSFSLI